MGAAVDILSRRSSEPGRDALDPPMASALREALRNYMQEDIYLRRREVLADRKKRFYERGIQHVFEDYRTGALAVATPGGVFRNSYGQDVQAPNYIGDYNIFEPYERIAISVLSQNPPGIVFSPRNAQLSEDIEAAKAAEAYKGVFDANNDVKALQTEIARMFHLSGRTFIWTRLDPETQKETATVGGTIESRVSIIAKKLSDSPYFCIFDDPHLDIARYEYPDYADRLQGGATAPGENNYDRLARIGVAQSGGVSGGSPYGQNTRMLTTTLTRAHVWLSKKAFANEKFTKGADGSEGVRQQFDEMFPNGVHAVFLGEILVSAEDQAMESCITVGFPFKGEGMFRMAIMDPMVVIQDSFNDMMNVSREIFSVGWPSTWINVNDNDFDAIRQQVAIPYGFRQMKLSAGADIRQNIVREANPELPATFMPYTELLMSTLPQFIQSTPPSLWGQQMQDQKTASGYHLATAQALGQQGVPFAEIQRMMAAMYKQAAILASSNPAHDDQTPTIETDAGVHKQLGLAAIRNGMFGVKADDDDSSPETPAQKRGTLANLITLIGQSPMGASLFASPDNWAVFNRYLGLPDLEIPQAAAREKQMAEVEQLLLAPPVGPSPEEMAAALAQAAATGQQLDPASLMHSSIPIGPLDFHLWEFEWGREWLSSSDAREEQQKGNSAGLLNVLLHLMEHKAAAEQEALQNAAAQPQPTPPLATPHSKGLQKAAQHGAPQPQQPAQPPQPPTPAA